MAKKNVRKEDVLGKEIDALASLRNKRLAQQAKADALKQAETEAQSALIEKLIDAGLSQARGKRASVTINKKVVPHVEPDAWPKVWAYVAKHEAWDLLHKRISQTAFADRIEQGEQIAGIDRQLRVDLSIRNVGR